MRMMCFCCLLRYAKNSRPVLFHCRRAPSSVSSPKFLFCPLFLFLNFCLYCSLTQCVVTPTPHPNPPPSFSPCSWPSFPLPLPSPVQWRFSEVVIHSCSRRCLMVMWPKPAWQHGEWTVWLVCVQPHAHAPSCKHTHAKKYFVASAHAHILSSFSQSDINSITMKPLDVHALRYAASFHDFILYYCNHPSHICPKQNIMTLMQYS